MSKPLYSLLLLFACIFLQEKQLQAQSKTRFNVYLASRNGNTHVPTQNYFDAKILNIQIEKKQAAQLGIGLQFGKVEDYFWAAEFMFHADKMDVMHSFDSINIINAGTLDRIQPELTFTRNNLHYDKKKFTTYFGYGLSTSFNYAKFTPSEAAPAWPSNGWIGGLNIKFHYRLVFKPSQHFWWQLGIGANALDLGYHYHKTENPDLTPRQQANGNFDFEMLGASRIFVACSFGTKKAKVEE